MLQPKNRINQFHDAKIEFFYHHCVFIHISASGNKNKVGMAVYCTSKLVLEEIGVETFANKYSYFTSETNLPQLNPYFTHVCFEGGCLDRSEVGN